MEDRFIDLAFEMGPVQGMTADDIKQYIRYIADWRLGQLGCPPLLKIYGVKSIRSRGSDRHPQRASNTPTSSKRARLNIPRAPIYDYAHIIPETTEGKYGSFR
jgi:hypothetical protein